MFLALVHIVVYGLEFVPSASLSMLLFPSVLSPAYVAGLDLLIFFFKKNYS